MPDIDNIKEFNKILKEIGAEAGQAPEETEDIPIPENPLGDELAEFLDTAASDSPAASDSEADTGQPAGSLDESDLNALLGEGSNKAADTEAASLDILPMDFQDQEPPAGEAERAGEPDTGADLLSDIPLDPSVGEQEEIPSIDLADLFPTGEAATGDEPAPDLPDDIMSFDTSTAETGALSGTEESFAAESFDLPLDTENYQMDEPEEGSGDSAPPAGEPAADAPDDFGTPDIDFNDLPLDAFDDLVPPAADTGADPGADLGEFQAETSTPLPPQGDRGVDVDIPDIDFSPAAADEPSGGGVGLSGQDFELPEEFSLPEPDVDTLDDSFSPSPTAAEAAGTAAGTEERPVDFSDIPDAFTEDAAEIITAENTAATADDDFLIDEFNLPEITDDIGAPDTEPRAPSDKSRDNLPSSISFKEKKPAGSAPADEDIAITDEQFEALQDTLKNLPLNLKLLIEDLIGKQNLSGEPLHSLLDYLISGRSPKEIAHLVGQITGKRIVLPKKFEKKTGSAFEAEQKSLAYAFQTNILPILRVIIPAALIIVLSALGIHHFIVEPLRALSVYQQGYEYLEANRFPEANEKFTTALHIRPIKEQFFRFARGFTDKKQYEKAAEKYSQLLEQYPGDKQGTLAWANLESVWRKDHPKAEELLNRLLKKDPFDYEALLAAGDNYLAWALSRTDESRAGYFEQARESYFRILRTGNRDKHEPWFHLLHFFIVTDNLEETEKIKNQFEANKDIKVDPVVYSELGGYLITKDRLDSVKDVLTRALKEDRELPETYYHFARYFRKVDNKTKEIESLEYAKYYFEKKQPLTPARIPMLVNTLSWRGENFYAEGDTLQAEQEYNKAIELIKSTATEVSIPLNGDYGKVFYNRGDLYYNYYNDLDLALKDFREAESYLHKSPELDYKIGRISYIHEDYQESLLRFYNASRAHPHNPALLLATANTFLYRNDYVAAQGEYLLLLDILEERYAQIPLLRPAENPAHKNLLTKLMISHNNLGVTLKRLAETPRNPRKETEALLHFTKAAEYGDLLSRNPETEKRGEAIGHAYLNTRAILYPVSGYSLALYQMLPKNMTDDNWPTKP